MLVEDANLTTGWAVENITSATEKAGYGIVASLGIIGNSIVCFVFVRRPSPHNRCSHFIFYLAVADLTACFLAIPYHLLPLNLTFRDNRVFGELVCRVLLSKFPMWVSISASVNTLILLTVERYVACVHPLIYSAVFKRVNSRRLTVCCWTAGAVGCGYFMVTYGLTVEGQCVNHPFTLLYRRIIGVCVFTCFFIAPLGTMLGAHSQMIKTLRKHGKTFKQHTLGDGGTQNGGKTEGPWQIKKARKLQRLLFVVFLTYTACWAPNQIIFLIYSVGGDVDFSSWYYHWSVVITLANSCINPLIYAIGSKRFRKRITKAFRECSSRYGTMTKVKHIAI